MPITKFTGVWPYDRRRHAVLVPKRYGLTWIMRIKPGVKAREARFARRHYRCIRSFPAAPVTKIMRAIAHERGWLRRRR